MNLIRWNPVREVSVLHDQMNRAFEDLWRKWDGDSLIGAGIWSPTADIYETEDNLVVKAELPGVDPKEVDIRLEENVLTIRGERQLEQDVKKENYHQIGRYYGTFSRSFLLPADVDADQIRAGFKDGVLTVTLPKVESAKPKRIEIAAAAA